LDQSLSRVVPGAKRGSLAEQEHSAGLEIELAAVKTHVDLTKSDDDLRLAFTAFNPTDADIKICTRDTPLAGNPGKLLADLFVVQNQAAMVMPYRGKDMKMTEQPGPEEYITIPAGKAVTDVISLKAYKLAADGTYYIRVKQPKDSHIIYKDVMRTSVEVEVTGVAAFEARYAERERARGTEGEQVLAQTTAGAFSFNGCSSSEQATLSQWHEDALHKIASARACTEASCQAQVDAWFGASTTQSQFVAGATAQFNTMASVEGNTIYKCESGNSDMRRVCGGSTFAYVYPTDTQQNIYMCDFTFEYPDYSEKVQTVIHELSHFNHIGNTNDNAYGESTCINLAQSNFQAAIQTADNVGYFGKYANSCYRNAPNGYTPKNSPLQGCVDQYSNCQDLAANGCSSRVQGYCCQSCTGGAASNDCSGISAGAGGSTSTSSTDTRRRAPNPTPAPNPTTSTDSSSRDSAGNCASLVSSYGCTACCVSSGGDVASVCAATCRTGSTTTTTTPASSGDDSCRYANDNACDEPTYCQAGTDATDCA
jgi:peptidyl-Lys metalloendopeptidase